MWERIQWTWPEKKYLIHVQILRRVLLMPLKTPKAMGRIGNGVVYAKLWRLRGSYNLAEVGHTRRLLAGDTVRRSQDESQHNIKIEDLSDVHERIEK